jgi:hypothetical protein
MPKGWRAIEQLCDGRSEPLGLLPKCEWLAARKLIAIRNLQIRSTNVDPKPSTRWRRNRNSFLRSLFGGET